jgi:hypothetical protein
MAKQIARCRGIGALAGLWARQRSDAGAAPTGLRILVDLDEGTVSTVTWNGEGLATTGQSWRGQGILTQLLQTAAPLFGSDQASLAAFLLNRDAMEEYSRCIDDALLDDPESACLEMNGQSIPLSRIFSALEPLNEAIDAMARQVSDYQPEHQEAAGSLILYGTCAGYKPLQLKFRQTYHRMDDEFFFPMAVMEDSLFSYVPDDGTLARTGWQLLDSGEVAFGPPAAPCDLALHLTDAAGNDVQIPLAAKGQTAEELPGETAPFFLAPDSVLRLAVNSHARCVALPKSFLRSGCVAAAETYLEGRELGITLRDVADRSIPHSFIVDREVQ